jgi:uncharacterized phage protein (TIGR01671 family)
MEDRYLFKAKRADNGEWVQGYLFDDGFENGRVFIGGLVIEKYTGTACDDWTISGSCFCKVDKSTICQCTGLRDKNGKLIWENDIVKDKNGNFYKAIWQNNYYQYCWVCIKSNIELFVGGKRDLWSIVENPEIELAGNIFDNPELLESEE